jgi:hypothetical protein
MQHFGGLRKKVCLGLKFEFVTGMVAHSYNLSYLEEIWKMKTKGLPRQKS